MDNGIGEPSSDSGWDSLCSLYTNSVRKGMNQRLPSVPISNSSAVRILEPFKAIHRNTSQ